MASPSFSGTIFSTVVVGFSGSGEYSASVVCINGFFGNIGGSFGVWSLVFFGFSSSLDVAGPR